MMKRFLFFILLLSSLTSSAQNTTDNSYQGENLIGPMVSYDYQNGYHLLGGGITHFKVFRRYGMLPTLVASSHAALSFSLGAPRTVIAPNAGIGLHWWLLCADVNAFYFTDNYDKTFGLSIGGGMTFWGFCYGSVGYTFPMAGVDPLNISGLHVKAAIQVPFYKVKW